ncbi:TlpA family protein disulfide reductase [Stackebrandtia soli]|uniref:TlpA family protein disulfide reductase n=1 Tax=Stackebrandtia soli TaxID=1892856 RepID=UPI0039E9AD47
MSISRWLRLAAVLPILAGLAACAETDANADALTVLYSTPEERPDAPELSGEDLEGNAVDAADFDGQVVVVNFWASWCAPCRREGPELVDAADETADDGVLFIGINIRDDRPKAIAFEEALGVEYPSLFDPAGRLALQFEGVPPNTIPATIIIDAEGRIAAIFRQELTRSTLVDAIGDVLAD